MNTTTPSPSVTPAAPRATYPENPVLTRIWRGDFIESQHRGAWALVDTDGQVLEGAGGFDRPTFVRSAIKCVQALPLIETGAADALGYTSRELALALASHNAERQHTGTVAGILARLGLDTDDLKCGPQNPADPEARSELVRAGLSATALHNNCSGKHAGFLALAHHLKAPAETYIEPDSHGQRLVHQAVLEMTGLAEEAVTLAVDGCSAPTFRIPLSALGTAFARTSNPEALGATRRASCERMLEAVAAHPEAIAGKHKRICTDLARVSGGRLFPKVGGEAVYAIGIRGRGQALVAKVDDGSTRGLHALLVELLDRFGFLEPGERERLAKWAPGAMRNWAGLEVGHIEVVA